MSKNPKKPTQASKADKYALYQRAVQESEVEVKFFNRVFKKLFNTKPTTLREDFCGTFAICCDWVASQKDRISIGVDLDPEPLAWGREHNLSKLKPKAQERVTLLEDDVRSVGKVRVDVLAAQNFSFWIFKTRPQLVDYFKVAYQNLADQGMMVLDMMGGSECWDEGHVDVRKYKRFTYEWEQAMLDPITHDARFHIHFAFKDGSRLEKAFTYEWRFWSIPEVKEMLLEAGFDDVHVYWENTDSEGEGTGIYRQREHAPADPCWIAYIVGVRAGETATLKK